MKRPEKPKREKPYSRFVAEPETAGSEGGQAVTIIKDTRHMD